MAGFVGKGVAGVVDVPQGTGRRSLITPK
jgi:hypothetical protein